ncbi:hypothetical protein [Vibrio mediterranei]|uniref:hypothetical protein n=1 Tax=Vibrio mediterranei TaxID=689 RepID=UPI0040682609
MHLEYVYLVISYKNKLGTECAQTTYFENDGGVTEQELGSLIEGNLDTKRFHPALYGLSSPSPHRFEWEAKDDNEDTCYCELIEYGLTTLNPPGEGSCGRFTDIAEEIEAGGVKGFDEESDAAIEEEVMRLLSLRKKRLQIQGIADNSHCVIADLKIDRPYIDLSITLLDRNATDELPKVLDSDGGVCWHYDCCASYNPAAVALNTFLMDVDTGKHSHLDFELHGNELLGFVDDKKVFNEVVPDDVSLSEPLIGHMSTFDWSSNQ